MKRLRLINGPWHGRVIEDIGTAIQKMTIADRWDGNRPAIGARIGAAIYEPDRKSRRSFWSHNEWHGRCVAIIPADDFPI